MSLQLKNISFGYQSSEDLVLRRLNLEFPPASISLLVGATGSGKSSLLKCICGLAPHFTGGNLVGQIQIAEQTFTKPKPHEVAHLVGYVGQYPEASFVAETVIDELAFSLEQLGFQPNDMEARIAKVAQQLAIEDLLNRQVSSLSGGQQQRVAIAAALSAGQQIILLDEPTSALDLDGAISTMTMLRELADSGVTVILAEHRISDIVEFVDHYFCAFGDGSVRRITAQQIPKPDFVLEGKTNQQNEVALRVQNLSVSYENMVAVQPTTLELHMGSITGIRGANGSGKSSLLWAIHGAGPRDAGDVYFSGVNANDLKKQELHEYVALVPQLASDLLFLSSVGEELAESDAFGEVKPTTTAELLKSLVGRIDPSIHPRDLSAGQQLALVIASQLVRNAGVLLLDEPTRGLDVAARNKLANQLIRLRNQGKCILIATHDAEFLTAVTDKIFTQDSGVLTRE